MDDFSGDGKLNLVVANSDSNNVSGLLGNGDGTFQQAMNLNVGNGPASVAVGDFDGDGKLDLAVVDTSGGHPLSVPLGNGDGSFQPPMMPSFVALSPISVAVGDFDGDGKPDLAVADDRTGAVRGVIWVLLGNGDGTFRVLPSLFGGLVPRSIIVGDFNGDGNLDLGVAKLFSNDVSILLGNGDGTFQGSGDFITAPQSILAENMDDAAKLDLSLTKLLSENPGVLVDSGLDPSFGADLRPFSVAAGDFDCDGKLDLAVANSGSNNVSVLINDTPDDTPKKRWR